MRATRKAALNAVLVAALTAACDADSTQSGSPGPTAGPVGSASATLPATGPSVAPTGDHIVVHWEPFTPLESGEIHAIDVGDDGWLALGNCLIAGELDERCSVAVSSIDGRTWTEHSIPYGKQVGGATELVRVRDKWLAMLDQLWSSPDGIAWQKGDTVQLRCCPDTEPFYQDLSAAPNGSVVARLPDSRGGTVGPVVSKDGLVWNLVDQEQFGSDTFWIDEIAATPSAVLLSGGACRGCLDGIWSSTDGRTWTKVVEPGILQGGSTSFASDGTTTIASISDCPTYAGCRTHIWASTNGGPWSSVIAGLNVRNARLAVTDAGFVAIGEFDNEYTQLASIDGRTWTEVANDGLPSRYDTDDCGFGDPTAVHDTIVVTWGDMCGPWWRGTVEVVPGPGLAPGAEATLAPLPSVAVATLGPSQSLDATAVLGDVCLYEPGRARIPIVITWSGNVPIGSIDAGIDGDGGSNISFPANTFGTYTMSFDARTTTPHTARVTLSADGPAFFDGAVVKLIDLPAFTVDPKNLCH